MKDKIKIGETEYEVAKNPELLKLIGEIRSEEKEKLHGTITGLKSQLETLKASGAGADTKALEKTIADLETKNLANEAELKVINDTKAEADKLKKLEEDKKVADGNKKTEDDKVSELIDNKLSAAFEKFDAKFTENITKMNEGLSGTQTQLNSAVVAQHKKDLLKKHEGYILPELLNGTTVEELNKSAEKALETSKKYIRVKDAKGVERTLAEMGELSDKAAADAKIAEEKNKIVVNVVDGKLTEIPKPPIKPVTEKDMETDINKMSSKDFNENKEALKKSLMEQAKSK